MAKISNVVKKKKKEKNTLKKKTHTRQKTKEKMFYFSFCGLTDATLRIVITLTLV